VASFARGDTSATFRQDGTFQTIHAGGLNIIYGIGGNKRVEEVRSDRTRIVSYGAREGYVERPTNINGIVQRTYLEGGVLRTHIYQTYTYQGIVIHEYIPSVHYSPEFYDWATRPWPEPVSYSWGSGVRSLHVLSGSAITPYPVYRSPSQWLTDYILADYQRNAYDQQQQGAASELQPGTSNGDFVGGASPAAEDQYNTPQPQKYKQLVENQVNHQLETDAKDATTSPAAAQPSATPSALDPTIVTFYVWKPLEVSSDGGECSLSRPDELLRGVPIARDATEARLIVSSTQRSDCPVNSWVTIPVAELQEMQNHFDETKAQGEEVLREQGNRGLLPAAPDLASQPSAAARGVKAPNTAEVGSEIEKQQQKATQVEGQVQQDASPGGAN
jgi:hypothetical protein